MNNRPSDRPGTVVAVSNPSRYYVDRGPYGMNRKLGPFEERVSSNFGQLFIRSGYSGPTLTAMLPSDHQTIQ